MQAKFIVSLVCYLSVGLVAVAQPQKKAERYYNAAMSLHAKKQYEKACLKMERAIASDPTYGDAYSALGQWYFTHHRFAEALNNFRNASLKCRNGAGRFAKPLALSYIYNSQPDNALSVIGTYANGKDLAEWDDMREDALFIKQALLRPLHYSPFAISPRINSSVPELFPMMAADTARMYFTRRVNNMDDDLFYSDADSCGGWFTPNNLGDPPNTSSQELSQFISADGHYLFYTRCENRTYDGWAEGGCDIFMSYRAANDSPWFQSQPFGATINTLDYEGMPSLSADNRELFFVSDREGGYGGYDIWISRFENGLWQKPFNAGPTVNTKGNEIAPYINLDNRTLYFTSDGWPGMGGYDLFVSRKVTDNSFEQATNLGYPINTPYDEQSSFVSADARLLYFASDRQGPAGNYDIYATPMPTTLQPIRTSYLKGYVYDSVTKELLNSASMYICDAHTGDTLYHFLSNRGDASFLMTVPAEKTYALHVGRYGHLFYDDTIEMTKEYLDKPMEHNVAMLPNDFFDLKPIKDTMIAMLHFDVNRVELSAEEKLEIRNAMAPWIEEQGLVVYVNAYTDNTGTPIINEGLSQKRAKIVAQAIVDLGLDVSAISAKGWGEANTIASNDTEDGQRMNRRVEIIVKR